MGTSTKSSAINYGLILGAILSLFAVIAYAVNLDLFTNIWIGLTMMAIPVIIGVMSTIKSKRLLNGFITFKEAFTSYFIPIAIGLGISTLIYIIIFNFVDPEASKILQDKLMDSQVEMMRNWGAPEESVALAVEAFEKEENMFSIGNNIQSFVIRLIGYSIVGLIIALILKRNPVNEE